MNKHLLKAIGCYVNLISYFSPKYAAKLAIKLFSTPRKGRLDEKDAQYLSTAIQEVIHCNMLSIKTYCWKGEKDTILLVHGWESNTFRWRPLIEILKALNYTVVALDAPAHGNSSGKLFNAILYSECIHAVAKKFNAKAIIGHSVGGTATIFAQHNNPLKSIKKITLLGAPSDFVDIFKRYKIMMGYNKIVARAMDQYVLKTYKHPTIYFSAANFTKKINSDILVVHDKKDRIIPYSDGLKFKNAHDKIQFIETTGLGHGLKSEGVYNHIVDFLNA